MTQINENIKIDDAKVFFPRIRSIFKRYGIQDAALEKITLKKACELYNIDIDIFLSEIRNEDDSDLFGIRSSSDQLPKRSA